MDGGENNDFHETSESKNLAWYISEYRGAIIGGIIALLFIITGLSKLVISLVIIIAGLLIGNYVQKNKTHVKESLKEFIDKF